MPPKKTALISVYDKAGLEAFAGDLVALGFQILSTGNTVRHLERHKIPVREISEVTGSEEILGGRVKTLHPVIHAGILARDLPEHRAVLEAKGIEFIDLVAVNLYPFEEMPGIGTIDIGGPALLRAAAKNHERVIAVTDPEDYGRVTALLRKGGVEAAERKRLAAKVFARMLEYDAAIAAWFGKELRYGENPHQTGRFVAGTGRRPFWDEPLQGKELSYNNILDADAAYGLIREFDTIPFACAILKHGNPCGAAVSDHSLADAFEKSLTCDPSSAFGGIAALNREVDPETAAKMAPIFLEVILAPRFSPKALEIFSKKKNLRLLPSRIGAGAGTLLRSAGGGVLIQERDDAMEEVSTATVRTKRSPIPKEMEALQLAWRVAKHVRSNAIVLATADRTVGVGAGQMSRVDAVRLARMKMGQAPEAPIVCASDAFFPFADNIEVLAESRITAVVQPGGSVRDAEVVAAADRHGIAMVFTGVRHFRH